MEGGNGILLGKTERVEGEFRRGGNGIPAEKTERVEVVEEGGGGEAGIKFPRKGRNGGGGNGIPLEETEREGEWTLLFLRF